MKKARILLQANFRVTSGKGNIIGISNSGLGRFGNGSNL